MRNYCHNEKENFSLLKNPPKNNSPPKCLSVSKISQTHSERDNQLEPFILQLEELIKSQNFIKNSFKEHLRAAFPQSRKMGKIHVKVSVYRDQENQHPEYHSQMKESSIPLKAMQFLNNKNAQINLMSTLDSLSLFHVKDEDEKDELLCCPKVKRKSIMEVIGSIHLKKKI